MAITKPVVTASTAGLSGVSVLSGMLPLSTSGTNIVDQQGTPYRITGTSIGGFQTVLQMDGTWNYPYRTINVGGVVNIGIIDRLASAGFNCVRLLICEDVCFAGVKPMAYVNPNYNPDWFTNPADTSTVFDGVQLLDKVIAYCGSLGLRIILEMHALAPNGNNAVATAGLWYTTSTREAASTNPPTHTSSDTRNETDWLNAWSSIATRYAGNPIVIGADLVSEPYASSWGDGNLETDIAAAYTRCANVIQAANPNWLIFCEGIYQTLDFGPTNGGWVGVGWGAGLTLAGSNPVQPTIPNKVVYSPHDYGPGVCNFNYFNVPAFPGNMPAVWDQMFGYLVKDNIAPVWFGEIGDMLVAGANNGAETQASYQLAIQWINTLMSYVSGGTTTNGTPDVPAGSAGFSWSWFCWSTNGYSGTPGSIANTDLLMNDYNTVNTNVLQYITPHMAPLMLANLPVSVTLTLSAAASTNVTVQWTTSDSSAVAGTNYQAASGTATIIAGQTTTVITVPAIAFTLPPGNPRSRYFWMNLSQPSGCTIGKARIQVPITYA